MTQRQLESAVAEATGETLDPVQDLGFSLVATDRDDLEPEDLVLAVICPSCRRAVSYPGPTRDGSVPLAECVPCDLYFAITFTEIISTTRGRD
ncbi:hypothetical protein V5E97_11335 [Singulisphaera sp. Ch08]|uniref:Small CPxCG-related zinc finger protein n=1 Tax=Singulisphaera sp. Ch08 TaxID=3120278 RepID=A0AAU7CPR8_9BACT